MAHILRRLALAYALRKEIAPAMASVESCENLSGSCLADVVNDKLLERCPLLDSVFNETLRVSSSVAASRLLPLHFPFHFCLNLDLRNIDCLLLILVKDHR